MGNVRDSVIFRNFAITKRHVSKLKLLIDERSVDDSRISPRFFILRNVFFVFLRQTRRRTQSSRGRAKNAEIFNDRGETRATKRNGGGGRRKKRRKKKEEKRNERESSTISLWQIVKLFASIRPYSLSGLSRYNVSIYNISEFAVNHKWSRSTSPGLKITRSFQTNIVHFLVIERDQRARARHAVKLKKIVFSSSSLCRLLIKNKSIIFKFFSSGSNGLSPIRNRIWNRRFSPAALPSIL